MCDGGARVCAALVREASRRRDDGNEVTGRARDWTAKAGAFARSEVRKESKGLGVVAGAG